MAVIGHLKYLVLSAGVLSFCVAGPAGAALMTVDFEADAEGSRANGFTPSGASGVSFSDSVGEDLYLTGAIPEGSGSHSLFVGTDGDLSLLQISLSFTADYISLDFGNDDPNYTVPTDMAVLTAYLGSSQVGQSTVALNVNDLMDQTIIFGSIGGGVLFDYATFAYTNQYFSPAAGGEPVNLGAAEVVDNIVINTASGASTRVPEPGTLALLLAGVVGAALGRGALGRRAR